MSDPGRPGRGDHGGQLADHDLDPPPSRATWGGPQREAPTSVMVYLGGLGCMERDAQGVQARDEGCRTFARPWRASEMIAHEEQGHLRAWVDQHGKWSAAPFSPRFLGVGRGSFKYYIVLPIFNILDVRYWRLGMALPSMVLVLASQEVPLKTPHR